MRTCSTTLFLLSIGFAALAAQTSGVEKEVLAANKTWFDAFLRGDADAMSKMETDDFVFIQDGVLVDKPAELAFVRKQGQ